MAVYIQKLFRKKVIGLKVETTRGTYAAPTQATDLFAPYDVSVTIAPEITELDTVRNSLTKDIKGGLVGHIPVTLAYKIPLQHVATAAVTMADVRTALTPYMLMAGLENTNTYNFTPNDASAAEQAVGYSHVFNIDGIEYQVRGCAANMSVVLPPGGNSHLDMTVMGSLETCTEAAITTAIPSDLFIHQIWGGRTATIADGAGSPNTLYSRINSLQLNLNNNVVPYRVSGGTEGVLYYHITDRAPTAALVVNNPTDNTYATTDYTEQLFDALDLTQLLTFTMAASSTTFGMSFTGTQTNMQPTDTDGVLTFGLDVALRSNTAEGEFTLTFGAA